MVIRYAAAMPMSDPRITWFRGMTRTGSPTQAIGVLEVRADGSCRAAIGNRAELDGGTHIRLAREAWGWKDALDTRWWSLVLDPDFRAYTVRNGSCSDPLNGDDVPRVVAALEELGLMSDRTFVHPDDGPCLCFRRGGSRVRK